MRESSEYFVDGVVDDGVFTDVLCALLLSVDLADGIIMHALAHSATYLVRADVIRVFPESCSMHGIRKYLDGSHDEPRTNLNKRRLDRLICILFIQGAINNLVMSKPDTAVKHCKCNDMVHKRLCLTMPRRSRENMSKKLLGKPENRSIVEGRVEREEGAGVAEVVTREGELGHGVQVGEMELDRRAERGLREPEIQVLALTRLEEKDGVAGTEVGYLGGGGDMGLRV